MYIYICVYHLISNISKTRGISFRPSCYRDIHWTGHFPRAALTAPTWGAAAACVLQHRLPGLGSWGNRCRETPMESPVL